MAMPDFIGIGAQKAGTTWLYDMLAQNPSIWLPPLKEVHYFDYINAPEARRIKRTEHFEKVAKQLERGKLDKGSDSDGVAKAAFLRSLIGDHLHGHGAHGGVLVGACLQAIRGWSVGGRSIACKQAPTKRDPFRRRRRRPSAASAPPR